MRVHHVGRLAQPSVGKVRAELRHARQLLVVRQLAGRASGHMLDRDPGRMRTLAGTVAESRRV